MNSPSVYAVIPTRNRKTVVLECLQSVVSQDYPFLVVIVVDIASSDATAEAIRSAHPAVTVLTCQSDRWWAGATNLGVREALRAAGPADLVLTLNDDTICPPGYVTRLVAAQGGRKAIVGSVCVEAGGATVLDAGVVVNWWTGKSRRTCRDRPLAQCAGELSSSLPADLLSGRGTLVPAEAYRRIGLYDERRLPHYGADYEFAARARRSGWTLEVDGRSRLESYPHLTGIDVTIGRVSLGAMVRSLVSRRSSNCLWYRWVFAALAAPRPQVLFFLPLDTLRALAGMVRRQVSFRMQGS